MAQYPASFFERQLVDVSREIINNIIQAKAVRTYIMMFGDYYTDPLSVVTYFKDNALVREFEYNCVNEALSDATSALENDLRLGLVNSSPEFKALYKALIAYLTKYCDKSYERVLETTKERLSEDISKFLDKMIEREVFKRDTSLESEFHECGFIAPSFENHYKNDEDD